MKKSVWLFPLLAFGFGIQSLALAQGGARAANVRVALASIQSIAPETIVPGTVVSRSDARLSAEVTGRLMDVADVGTMATTGDVVAKIEDTVIQLRKQELEAEVERAQARLKYLESEESRYVKLAESNLAAATKLEETRSDRDVSRGDLRVAKSRLAQVEDQLSRTSIRAPFSGIVVERLMMPGERVDIGKNVVRMVDQQHLEVIARAPLEYYSYVTPGQELVVRTGNVVVTGMVRTVVAVGSENTHQFELRLDIESGSFPVGQTLRVSVPTSNARDALVVPRDALVLRPGAISVFVVDSDQKAKQVMVTTGVGSGDQIEVSGDLSDGSTVIIRGNERLRPGQSVSIMEG
ncbi:MAG: efflux RND transporter periplasmic adaptor subunit [Xanthomonadales bacterium]|nr:efflux RND transporter periplasmic adaptor subunit [Xanthomonadales bacterium]